MWQGPLSDVKRQGGESQRDMMSAVNISIRDPCSELPPILQPNLVSYIVEIKVGPVGSVAAWLRERSFKGRFGVT